MWIQATTWPEILRMARHCDQVGFDHVWAYDHLLGIFGDPGMPNFEGWTTLAALAATTERAQLGLLVGSNTYRNPGLVAKMAATVDHISGGRAILGIGSGWNEGEHRAYGFEFGTGFGQRLDWLDEGVGVMRRLFDGETVTSPPGARYAFEGLRLSPAPVQAHLPIMIGGAGERKTLRIVARYADQWNMYREPDEYARLDGVLRGYCEEIGRDPASIERTLGLKIIVRDSEAEARRVWQRQFDNNTFPADWKGTIWLGSAEQIAERLARYVAIGCATFIVETPAPYDLETASRLIEQVKPLLER
jgi:alkanesulfonate monooxygenase SsuD/methylene tetrahydromethanopterin reductase-like flavin-dependent oxidoreductase (luciferase family)